MIPKNLPDAFVTGFIPKGDISWKLFICAEISNDGIFAHNFMWYILNVILLLMFVYSLSHMWNKKAFQWEAYLPRILETVPPGLPWLVLLSRRREFHPSVSWGTFQVHYGAGTLLWTEGNIRLKPFSSLVLLRGGKLFLSSVILACHIIFVTFGASKWSI